MDLQGVRGKQGEIPANQWNGTCLRFQNPDGTWGADVDLQGIKGDPGIGKAGTDARTPIKGKDYFDGKPGKDAEIPKAVVMTVLVDVDIIDGKLQKRFQQINIYPTE